MQFRDQVYGREENFYSVAKTIGRRLRRHDSDKRHIQRNARRRLQLQHAFKGAVRRFR